jgi:hypothetical protein
MKRSFLVWLVLCLGILIGSAVQAQSVNVGQVDGSSSSIPCMSPGEGNFVAFPELTLSLETHGRPVMITFNVQVQVTPDQAALLRPSIDGQSPAPYFTWAQIGSGSLGIVTLSFARVFVLPKGPHTFGLQMSCQGEPEFVAGRWLTVYELW